MAELVAQFMDKSGEVSTVVMKIADQIGATTMTAVIAFGTTLETELEAISLLRLQNIWFRQSLITEDPGLPTSEYANRENGIRVFFHNDTSNEKGRVTIPGPDLVNVARAAGSDLFDLADTELASLITWMEANLEFDGESVTVDRAVYIGRNT